MMNICVLDKSSMGIDTPFDAIYKYGNVEIYDTTTEEQLAERIKHAEVIITNKVKLNDKAISSAQKLKLICVFATGFDNIDLSSARTNKVAVCNVPGYSTDSVTLLTISTALALCSHLKEYNEYVTSGKYTESGVANRLTPVFHELRGKTWGIVGLGNIGRAVAKVAEAMGATVIAYKRSPVDDYECIDIDELCRRSDIITLHCPLNDGTKNLINKDRIDLMKKDVVIVNEARGAVVNEADIRDAILNNRIGAFGSDVYSMEPFPQDHPFFEIKERSNVLLTPHAAWGAFESRARCLEIICQNIRSFIEGEILNRVDI